MEIIFARHGNTFGPGDKVVWVGSETDIPLVEKGRKQAHAVGEALLRTGRAPSVIYAACLKRTREFAEIVQSIVKSSEIVIDARLNEVDYGALGGLTTEEMIARNPDAEKLLALWGEKDIWPQELGWASSEAELAQKARNFVAERLGWSESEHPMVVSSNGTIRFLARALASSKESAGGLKLSTGALGIIERTQDGEAVIRSWNVAACDLPG